MHAWWSEYDGMRLIMASIGLSRTQLSSSGLQVGDLKASVTPSLHRCCVDVSVSCSCAHLQGQHDARSRPLLLRSLGPKVSEGTRHHRHALDGLPRRKPCTTAVWDESVSFPRLAITYVSRLEQLWHRNADPRFVSLPRRTPRVSVPPVCTAVACTQDGKRDVRW